ncbi:glycosyltransferase involved in cell wall biosynthesis [Bacillus mesophilus]|uniref:Glycosyltransferase family 4 protein n=1 Tax=Bacillus mesophilus TaxID=1808955 RepID=A0A6M0Q7N7_9BACI|nr:glycosyltransferase family 4 protein [Bacillus mesophilus]MBM7661614.1 glycosyltransferase involved in cell wall biosynthesis [Bacillus mesophilus]NEY72283.1 glycosyltransferase family 4 protein [Bacillus mesophilus]
MKKIASIVLNNFVNDSRVLKECVTLQNDGNDVTVIALHEGDLKEYEEVNGIKVYRIKLKTRNLPKNLIGQIIKYVELSYKILKKLTGKIDIVHCNDLMPLPISVAMKLLTNGKTKIVYDAHEFQTETQKLQGKTLRKKLATITETILITKVDKVITVSEGIAKEYEKRYTIKKPELVLNCPNYYEVSKTNKFRELFGIREDQKILLYQGALATGRGIEKLVEAMKELQKERDDVVLVFMGMGHLKDFVKNEAQLNKNIHFLDAVPPSEVLDYTVSADIGVSLIENSCLNYYYSLPNKVFEYIMSGLPVIVSDLPEMKRIVEENNCGVAVEISTEGFKESISNLLEEDLNAYKKNSLAAAKKYNWEIQEQVLLNLYRDLL